MAISDIIEELKLCNFLFQILNIAYKFYTVLLNLQES